MLFWLLFVVVMCFGVAIAFGAPYLPIRRPDAEVALELAQLKAGETFIDLGSGDGRMLLLAAQRGANAVGYEINPLMWLWSQWITRSQRRHIKIYCRSFWGADLSQADVIYTFLVRHFARRLHRKLQRETTRPTRVVSYVFELPSGPVKKTANTFLYRYPA